MQHAFHINADFLQAVQIIEKLEQMCLLQSAGTLYLVDFAFAQLQKVNFNPPNAHFLKLAPIALLMKKLAQQDQVGVSFKSEIMRKKPQLTPTNKIVVNLSTSVRKAIL